MIFYPKSYFKNILEIDMNFIEKNNIKAILLDIDNTMIDTDNKILKRTGGTVFILIPLPDICHMQSTKWRSVLWKHMIMM